MGSEMCIRDSNKFGEACAMAIVMLLMAGLVMILRNCAFREEKDVY